MTRGPRAHSDLPGQRLADALAALTWTFGQDAAAQRSTTDRTKPADAVAV